MQSVDEFTPSTTEPVFGSGLVSQKVSSSTNNETNDNEKVIPSAESTVNGQNDSVVKSTENGTNGVAETTSTNDSSTVQVNGQHETTTTTTAEVQNDVKPVEESDPATEQANQVEPEPVSSTPMETSTEPSSTTVDSATAESTETAVESTSTSVEAPVPTESAPEAPVATASETTEVKGKSPRGRAAKTPAPAATTTPTRQSSRGRKPATTSNGDENTPTVDEPVSITPAETATSSTTPQRNKRQAPNNVPEVVAVSSQPISTNDVDNQETTAVVAAEDEQTESPTKGTPGRKRGAPKSTPTSAKKPRGRASVTSSNDVDTEAVASTDEITATPPKKARTSATKKTPEPPSEEYARKLRPRK